MGVPPTQVMALEVPLFTSTKPLSFTGAAVLIHIVYAMVHTCVYGIGDLGKRARKGREGER